MNYPVLKTDRLKLYYYYMNERNNIYIKKEVLKEDYPWTNNEILRTNSFTCVKRWLDRTSRWLIDNISNNSELLYGDRVWRSIVFRLYNKIETAELIGLSDIDFWDHISESMDKLDRYENDPFTRAYKVIKPKYAYRDMSPSGHNNWKSSLLWYISTLRLKYVVMNDNTEYSEIPFELLDNAQSAIDYLKDNIIGVGDFIAYQIWCDLCYIEEYPMSTNEFTIAGPGCCAGIDILVDNLNGMTHNKFLYWMRNNINTLFKYVDNNYDINRFFWYLDRDNRYWDLQDIENSFCEYSKLVFLMEGRHKRPRKYIPKEI